MKEVDDKKGIGHDVIGRGLRQKHEMALIECADPNNNSPVSEASSRLNPKLSNLMSNDIQQDVS